MWGQQYILPFKTGLFFFFFLREIKGSSGEPYSI